MAEEEDRLIELERVIEAVIARKNAAPEGSAEYRMALRQIAGLRHSCEEANGIIESLDPWAWGYF